MPNTTFNIEQRDTDLHNSSANVHYVMEFDEASRHLVWVEMSFQAQGDTTVTWPVWTPGSYKLREYASHVGNLEVKSENGTIIPFSWNDKTSIHLDHTGKITLRFVVYAHDRTVRTSHVNRAHAFVMPGTMLPFVHGLEHEIHHVRLDYEDMDWGHCATQLSHVEPGMQGKPGTYGALNYDLLVDSPIEIGNHEVHEFTVRGAQHEVAIAGYGDFDGAWLTEKLEHIVATEADFWDGLPYDRYVFILQLYPGMRGGLEHTRSSVNMWDSFLAGSKKDQEQLLSLLCHEFFHTWNVKRIRPIELGPFDYTQENYTSMLWLAEGVTSYYDDLLTYRCGFYTQERYLEVLSENHLQALLKTPGRMHMSIKDSSFLAWTKLYLATADSRNRFPSYYLKGGIIFWLLDILIIAETDAKMSLDNVMHVCWSRYLSQPDRGMTEEEFLGVLSDVAGTSVADTLHMWLHSTSELPYKDILYKAGVEWKPKEDPAPEQLTDSQSQLAKLPQAFTGLAIKEQQGVCTVAMSMDASPAAIAGIGIDDEILAVNGQRVTSERHFDALMSHAAHRTQSVEVTLACDGNVYTTSLQPMVKKPYSLQIIEQSTETQLAVRNLWLRVPTTSNQ